MNPSDSPILIANRGEIAIRVARTARRLGFPTIAIYSDADRDSEHVPYCDRAVYVGSAEPKESYLRVEAVIEAARQTGAKLVHPGYGFLSERPHFVEACEKSGLVFVGPSAESMRIMGDKITARQTVDRLGVPRVPGSPGAVKSVEEAIKYARQAGFPVLLKAAAGGGGKGMRRVDREEDLAAAFESAGREALGAFGDDALYVEKLILEPHHVEIQVFGDGRGGAIHLGERECSIQRRHQKVWEETPAPILEVHPETRQQMFESALLMTREIRYAGAGTFEFIVDGAGKYYFLEMNTRLQVEHPVTEWVTGKDLVELQLLLASGNLQTLPPIPERRGSALEVRLYAEDPQRFLPAPGQLEQIQFPFGPFVRVDTALTHAGEVSRYYDPMIAKISVWGETREQAVGRMRVALDETRVLPPLKSGFTVEGSLKTNLEFLQRLTRCEDAIQGKTTTDLIPKNPELTADRVLPASDLSDAEMVALALASLSGNSWRSIGTDDTASTENLWSQIARREGVRS